MDNDSIGYRISYNTVASNRTAGIEAEISYDGVIDGNTVTGSGLWPLVGDQRRGDPRPRIGCMFSIVPSRYRLGHRHLWEHGLER